MSELDLGVNARRRKLTGKATLVFLAIMVLLTFFSNTINNFSLPKVSYETPSRGALIKEVTGTGSVKAKSEQDRYIQVSMRVTGVAVKVGDKVKQGQTLLTLDTSDIKSQLQDEQDKYAQLELNLDGLVQTGAPGNLLNMDKAIMTASQNLDKAQKNYADCKSLYAKNRTLYESGSLTAKDLEDAKTSLDNAKLDYDTAKIDFDIAKSNKDKTISDNSRNIENTKLNMSMEARRISELKDQIKLGTIMAPCDGTVTELNFSEGTTANNSKPLYKIAEAKGGFQFTAVVDVSASDYLEPGDTAEITINSLNGRPIEGKVGQITDDENQIGVKKDVVIDVPPDGLIGGETGTADIRKNMGSYDTLVSNSAIGQDSDGYFVYVLNERRGPLGNELYVQRVTIAIGDSDNVKTAVTSGVSQRDNVISDSNKALTDGTRVMLADQG